MKALFVAVCACMGCYVVGGHFFPALFGVAAFGFSWLFVLSVGVFFIACKMK